MLNECKGKKRNRNKQDVYSIDNDQANMNNTVERENVDYIKNKIIKHNNNNKSDDCIIEIPEITKEKEMIKM